MDTARLRTIGVQTSVRTANACTQTSCFGAVHGYAENLADWVIAEAFKYGRDLEKFASCIVDCILMEVFMAKSLRNLASYVEECKEADKPYPPVFTDSENVEEFIRLTNENALKGSRTPFPFYQNDNCATRKPIQDDETQRDNPSRSELNSALSNPDSLQMLEDDIIRCLQTLTDDEEELASAHPNSDCFSDNSLYQQFSSQVSELDSGFLSSEDAISVDQRIVNTRKPNLPSLTEELEESFKFKWPELSFRNKSEIGISSCDAAPLSRTETRFHELADPMEERQKLLRGLLVRELKVSVECRRRKIEKDDETEDVNTPSRPTFKAQATKSVWVPDPLISTRSQEQQFQSTEPSAVTRLENLEFAQNRNENSAKCRNTFFEENPCIEDLSISSRGLNGLSKTHPNDDVRKVQKLDSSLLPSQNIDQTNLTCIGTNEKQCQNAMVVDKKITIENNEIHTDTYYAAPIHEITTKNKVIKAPTYDGIGPTEDGIPIGLRTAVQKEYSSDWYKTMFRSLHRQDKPEEKKLSDGYMSDPEFTRKERAPSNFEDKSQPHTISNGSRTVSTANGVKNALNHPFPAAKSSYRPYNHKPWIISDYEPGYSSIADTEAPYENKRHLPPLISLKPKYVCSDGYESDSTLIRKTGKVHAFNPQEQKQWYQEIQKGGDIPIYGLGKPAPEKMKEPIVGPPPPIPANWDADHYYNIYSTTETDENRNDISMLHVPDKSVNNYSQDKLPKLQEDFRSKLDEVLSQREDNLRHSPRKPPAENSQLNSKSQSSSPSTSPLCPFKVTVLYDFEAQTSRELSIKKGDIVNVRRKIDKNWLEGEHHGIVGIFPISYVEPVSTKSSHKTTAKVIEGSARAKFDFTAQNSVELSLQKDDIITLIRQVDSNWYEGKLNEKTGIFPICYVEVISGQIHGDKPSQKLIQSSVRNHVEKEEPNQYSSDVNPEVRPERDTESSNEIEKETKIVIHNHEGNKVIPPQNEDELELEEGDVIYVVEKCDDGWFVGTSMRTGLFGTFPGNYVEII